MPRPGLLLLLAGSACAERPELTLHAATPAGITACDLAGLVPSSGAGAGRLSEGGLRRLGAGGVFKGLSGAPVYRGGELCGGVCAIAGTETTPGFLFAPIDAVRRIGAAAVAAAPVDTAAPVLEPGAPLAPGDFIDAFTLWGDLHSGPVGTVTAVEDGLVYGFSHLLDEAVGARHRVLQRARALAVSEAEAMHFLEVELLEVVGASFFEGPFGVVGRLGLLPPHFRLRAMFPAVSDPPFVVEVFVAVNADLQAEEALLMEAFAPWVRPGCVLELERSRGEGYAWRGQRAAEYEAAGRFTGEELDRCMTTLGEQARPGADFRLRIEMS